MLQASWDFAHDLALALGEINPERLLSELSLTQYRRWIDHVRRQGLPLRNQEALLRHLNAGVFNATGRMKTPLTADDFDWRDRPSVSKPQSGVDQAVLNQMLGDMSSLSFDSETK